MTAVSLFDSLARDQLRASDSQTSGQLAQLAAKLVAASLMDLGRVQEYERAFVAADSGIASRDSQVLRAVFNLYSQWADEADEVLARARSVTGAGQRVEGAAELNDQIGRIRARLNVTPDQIAHAIEQVRQGQVVPAKELRDELHARLRA